MAIWKAFTDEEARLSWDNALARFDDCSPFQSWAWGEYRRGLGWRPYRWAAFNERNEIVAMLQAYVRRHQFGVGMLWSEGGPVGDLSACDESLQSTIRETIGLKRLYCRFRCDRPRAIEDVLQLKSQGWNVPWATLNSNLTMLLDLTQDESDLLGAAERNWRRNIRRATNHNVTAREWLEPSAEEILAVFRSMEELKGLEEQHSREEIEELLARVGRNLVLYRSDDENGNIISVGAAVVASRGANLWLRATTEHGRKAYASYAVFWALVQHCKRIGVTSYDLGGIDPVNNAGVYRFKKDSGATLVELLGEWDWATRPWLRWLGNLAIAQRHRVRKAEQALHKPAPARLGPQANAPAAEVDVHAVAPQPQSDTLLAIES